jgi:hypothetical protein
MIDSIDWKALAKELGSIGPGGEVSGSNKARRAIEILIGEPALRASVDHYIAQAPRSELARSVLWLLRPWSAMVYCHDIWKSSASIEVRRSAVELLRVVADHRALIWIEQFLADQDEGIQICGAGVLDQLLWSYLVSPEEAEPLLVCAENHITAAVRECAKFIRGYLRTRLESEPRNADDSPLIGSG